MICIVCQRWTIGQSMMCDECAGFPLSAFAGIAALITLFSIIVVAAGGR